MIRLEDVSIKIKRKEVLKDISFTVNKGSFCVLCGKEGAGKTILLNIIMGLYPLKNGEVYLFDKKRNRQNKSDFSKIRYAADDILWIKNMRVEKYFRWAQAQSTRYDCDLQAELCEKWNVDYHEKLLEMSFCDNKKVMLIAAISANPEILIMDKPSRYLDSDCYEELLHILRDYCDNGGTVLIAEEEADTLSGLAERFIYIKDGTILREGQLGDYSQKWKVLKIHGDKDKIVSDERFSLLRETDFDRFYLCKEGSDFISAFLKNKKFTNWAVEELTFSEQLEQDFSRWS